MCVFVSSYTGISWSARSSWTTSKPEHQYQFRCRTIPEGHGENRYHSSFTALLSPLHLECRVGGRKITRSRKSSVFSPSWLYRAPGLAGRICNGISKKKLSLLRVKWRSSPFLLQLRAILALHSRRQGITTESECNCSSSVKSGRVICNFPL